MLCPAYGDYGSHGGGHKNRMAPNTLPCDSHDNFKRGRMRRPILHQPRLRALVNSVVRSSPPYGTLLS